jgi:hypothetical protein
MTPDARTPVTLVTLVTSKPTVTRVTVVTPVTRVTEVTETQTTAIEAIEERLRRTLGATIAGEQNIHRALLEIRSIYRWNSGVYQSCRRCGLPPPDHTKTCPDQAFHPLGHLGQQNHPKNNKTPGHSTVPLSHKEQDQFWDSQKTGPAQQKPSQPHGFPTGVSPTRMGRRRLTTPRVGLCVWVGGPVRGVVLEKFVVGAGGTGWWYRREDPDGVVGLLAGS